MTVLSRQCLVFAACVSGAAAGLALPRSARLSRAAQESTPGHSASGALRVASFSRYPGYEGELEVSGSVSIEQSREGTQVLSWELRGTDSACGVVDTSGVKNACGLHVHKGTACEEAGGHFYADSLGEDPWAPISYVTEDGDATGRAVEVRTGVELSEVAGRTFVVHDVTGARVACGLLPQPSKAVGPLKVVSFSPYPGYAGDLRVHGSVTIGESGAGTQVVSFDLKGTDLACGVVDISGVKNACGVHIHEGTACEKAGGHYYSTALSEDPWAPIVYVTKNGGAQSQQVEVKTETELSSANGRTFVVHDIEGSRVACGSLAPVALIEDSLRTAGSFQRYPGYTGDLNVTGTVEAWQVGTGSAASQVLRFDLTGVDSACGTANITGVGNACGIHVHEGKDCADQAKVGGHYWDKSAQASDPWKPIRYTVKEGRAVGITTPVVTGFGAAGITGRSMVVHDKTGSRVACAQIG